MANRQPTQRESVTCGKCRIAILGSRGIPGRYGGFETFAEELSVRLAEAGYEVTVFCEGTRGDCPERYRGVKLLYVSGPSGGGVAQLIYDVRCLWKARRAFDIVYMLGYGASPFCFIPRVWGRRLWINLDGLEWKRRKWNWPARQYLKWAESVATKTASRLIADARGIEEYIRAKYREHAPISHIPYGAKLLTREEPVYLHRLGVKSGFYYLVVARLEPENNIDMIVRAHGRLGSPLPLLVVGDVGKKSTYVQRLLRQRTSRVVFLGGIYDPKMLSELRAHCAAYIHGHSVGGTNPSLLEAMGAGNVILAHDNCFNREVCGSGALYFTDEDQLLEALWQCGASPELAKELSSAGLERAKTEYAWTDVAAAYQKLLVDDGCRALARTEKPTNSQSQSREGC